MKMIRVTITPLSAFGTRPLGDTLFGQLCWGILNRYGEEKLGELLEGYIKGEPFAVVSDVMPDNHIPRPVIPGHWYIEPKAKNGKTEDRKETKKRAWLPVDKLALPVAEWLDSCVPAGQLPGTEPLSHGQTHNTINRLTGTTGTGQFAPYSMNQLWYGDEKPDSGNTKLNIYLVVDEHRIDQIELLDVLRDMGLFGFGRDASIGLGKFSVDQVEDFSPQINPEANAFLTLAPSAPQGLGFDAGRSFYKTFTRFGRHGDVGVHLANPFKTPVLLAQAGAVLTPFEYAPALFQGQGLGGHGLLSKAIPETIQQGYAPVIGIRLPDAGSP